MSSAFYEMQKGCSLFILCFQETMEVHIQRNILFLIHLRDIIFCLLYKSSFSVFFFSFNLAQEIRFTNLVC